MSGNLWQESPTKKKKWTAQVSYEKIMIGSIFFFFFLRRGVSLAGVLTWYSFCLTIGPEKSSACLLTSSALTHTIIFTYIQTAADPIPLRAYWYKLHCTRQKWKWITGGQYRLARLFAGLKQTPGTLARRCTPAQWRIRIFTDIL